MTSQESIRILILGDSGVGKSTFVLSFIHGYISSHRMMYPTVGVNFESTNIVFKDIQYRLFFYDSSGQDKFKAFLPLHYKDLHCIIFMYDLTSSKTRDNIQRFIEDAKISLTKYNKTLDNVSCIIIANKYDLISNYDDTEKNDVINQCKELSMETNMSVILCSSKQEIDSYTSRSCIYHLMNTYQQDKIPQIEDTIPIITIKKTEDIENDDNNCACISQ